MISLVKLILESKHQVKKVRPAVKKRVSVDRWVNYLKQFQNEKIDDLVSRPLKNWGEVLSWHTGDVYTFLNMYEVDRVLKTKELVGATRATTSDDEMNIQIGQDPMREFLAVTTRPEITKGYTLSQTNQKKSSPLWVRFTLDLKQISLQGKTEAGRPIPYPMFDPDNLENPNGSLHKASLDYVRNEEGVIDPGRILDLLEHEIRIFGSVPLKFVKGCKVYISNKAVQSEETLQEMSKVIKQLQQAGLHPEYFLWQNGNRVEGPLNLSKIQSQLKQQLVLFDPSTAEKGVAVQLKDLNLLARMLTTLQYQLSSTADKKKLAQEFKDFVLEMYGSRRCEDFLNYKKTHTVNRVTDLKKSYDLLDHNMKKFFKSVCKEWEFQINLDTEGEFHIERYKGEEYKVRKGFTISDNGLLISVESGNGRPLEQALRKQTNVLKISENFDLYNYLSYNWLLQEFKES